MTQKHTALPWIAVTDFDGRHGHFPIMADWSYNDDDEPHHPKIASVSSSRMGVPADIAKANAAFIVRAVNSHYELLEAAKEFLKGYDTLTCGTFIGGEQALRQAIAKAEAAE
jgi:hypothetical protein